MLSYHFNNTFKILQKAIFQIKFSFISEYLTLLYHDV